MLWSGSERCAAGWLAPHLARLWPAARSKLPGRCSQPLLMPEPSELRTWSRWAVAALLAPTSAVRGSADPGDTHRAAMCRDKAIAGAQEGGRRGRWAVKAAPSAGVRA